MRESRQSYLRVLPGLAAKALKFAAADRQDAAGRGQRRPFSPRQHDEDGAQQAQDQRQKRHDPGHPVKTGAGRGGQNRGAVFLHEVLQGQIVVLAAIQSSHKFVAHAVGVGAAHVVAFQQNLVAATDAHQSVTKTVEASSVVTGAEEGKYAQAEYSRLKNTRHPIGQRLHNFRFSISDYLSIAVCYWLGRQHPNLRFAILNLKSLRDQSPAPTGAGWIRAGAVTRTGAALGIRASIVPPIMINTPTQIHMTSGFRWALMMGLPVPPSTPS